MILFEHFAILQPQKQQTEMELSDGVPYERNKELSLSFASIQLQEFLVPRRFKVSEKFTFYSFIIVPVCHL